MSPRYPLLLDVSGRRCVVVGGGPVAARRTRGLLDARASVLVVAPQLCEELDDMATAGLIDWRRAEYSAGDLDGAWVVHTATGDRPVDTQVAADAERTRVWCVRADDAANSAAWAPAVARSADVAIAIDAGGDPRRAVALRDAVLHQLELGELPLRRHRTGPGHVALVGGGPGDPGLVTARGRQLLAQADVVLADRLAPVSLLDRLDQDVEVIDVGKTSGNHPVPQWRINELLIERAKAGKRVVRLKGGDPFVLGRGGEELLACRAAGLEVEVVPGVTSAVAVPAAVGIPVTHRGLAKQFTVASGHEDLDYAALAGAQGTLVLLMGLTLLGHSADKLIEHGRDPHTPAAVIEDGYGPRQRVVTATLATIAERASQAGVRPPAIVVVGDVVSLVEEPR